MIFDLIMAAAGAESAPPYFVDSAFSATPFSTSIVVTKPSTVLSGDLLVAVCQSSSSVSWSGDTGWTELVDLGSTPSLRVAYKVATSSEPSSYTFSQSSSYGSNVHLIVIRGGSIGVAGSFAVNQNPLPAPSIAVSKDNSLLLACFAVNAGYVMPTTPSGMSRIAYDNNQYSPSSAVFSQVVQSGESGSRSSNVSQTSGCAGVLLSISPL